MHGERFQLAALTVGAGLALLITVPMASPSGWGLAQAQGGVPTLPVSEIKDGMKGYGLTVFKGIQPEKFDVEVVGVLHNFRPGQELVLIKTPHPRLNVTKNVKGMSGSPIYFDGRLAGAYAYSWTSFQVEPVAGMTPIAPMLAEMRRPIPPGFWPLEGAAPLPGKRVAQGGEGKGEGEDTVGRLAKAKSGDQGAVQGTAFDGAPGSYDLEEHARQVAARMAPAGDPGRAMVPVETPLLLGGVGDRTAAYVRKLFGPLGLEPLQAGGGGRGEGQEGGPEHYVDGGSVGIQLVGGDVSFMGLGTVTHVEGSRLCAFGHPMMSAGNAALPAVLGRVLWIFASDQHSSKIGEAMRPLGTMVQDRMSSIVVDETKTAPTFPMNVHVKGADGAPRNEWRTRVAEDKFMTPGFVASVLGAVVEATILERRDVTWRSHSRVQVRGHGTVDIDDYGVAAGGTPDGDDWGRSRVVRLVGDVLNNPWELTRIESVETSLDVQYTRELWRLRSVDLLNPTVDAGEKVQVRLHLLPLAGKEEVKVLDFPMPKELAGREVELEIAPGHEMIRELASPETLNELLANAARGWLPPRSVILQARLPSVGVTYRGHVASRLPGFALDALRPQTSDGSPDPVSSYARVEVPLERFVEGRAKVKVKVRSVVR